MIYAVILNATLAAVVLAAIVGLLLHGIGADRTRVAA
jgi:hypothetical protein